MAQPTLFIRASILTFAGILLLGFAACSDRSAPPEREPAAAVDDAADDAASEVDAEDAPEETWEPAALAAIDALAERVRAAGVPCDDFEVGLFPALGPDYDKRFGIRPAAEASCMTDEEEDLTFYSFASTADLDRFMTIKQDLLCRRAIAAGVPHFPGYPFVKGETWFIQPDERETAERLASLLGAAAGVAECPGAAAAAAAREADDSDGPIIVVFAEAEPDSGAAPLTVQFAISDPYNHLIEPTFHWDFGDGNTSDKRAPSHTYTKAGEYTAKLKVEDRGGTDEDEIEISVE